MKKALVVDDVEMNRELLIELLDDDFDVIEADNGLRAIEMMSKYTDEIAVIFLDLIMPDLDGFGVLERMRVMGFQGKFPVLIITGDDSRESEARCLDYGVMDFIRKPFNEYTVKLRARNAANLYALKKGLEVQVDQQTQELIEKNRKLEALNDDIVELLGDVVEARNQESGLHIKRVKGFTRILAFDVMAHYPEYGLDKEGVETITSASALHDVGKIMISDSILLKPGKLTAEEFDTMKQHSVLGCTLLERAAHLWDDKYQHYALEICRHHHERYSGKGYPDSLVGDEIPIAAQIVSVADTYDALVTKRCYKDPFPVDVAFNMIQNGECGVFNPKLLESLTRCREAMEDLVKENKEA